MKSSIKYPQKFQSNPFISTFEGLDKLLKINARPAVILFAVTLFLNLPSFIPNNPSHSTTTNNTPGLSAGAIVFICLLTVCIVMLTIALGVFLNGMLSFVTYKTMQDQKTNLKEAFGATKAKFWVILWTLILTGIRIFFGFILFVIPGIRASLRYQMVLTPIFDEDMSASQAIKHMKIITKGRLMEIFGINTVAMILFPAATLLKMGGESIMYPQLVAVNKNKLETAPTHWLNYLGLFLLLGFIVLLIFIVVLLILLAKSL